MSKAGGFPPWRSSPSSGGETDVEWTGSKLQSALPRTERDGPLDGPGGRRGQGPASWSWLGQWCASVTGPALFALRVLVRGASDVHRLDVGFRAVGRGSPLPAEGLGSSSLEVKMARDWVTRWEGGSLDWGLVSQAAGFHGFKRQCPAHPTTPGTEVQAAPCGYLWEGASGPVFSRPLSREITGLGRCPRGPNAGTCEQECPNNLLSGSRGWLGKAYSGAWLCRLSSVTLDESGGLSEPQL